MGVRTYRWQQDRVQERGHGSAGRRTRETGTEEAAAEGVGWFGPWGAGGGGGGPGSCPALSVPPAGVKEEAVKEEPVEVKTEPFHSPAANSIPGRSAERRLHRVGIRPPGELCEGWSRTPPCPAPPELSLGDLGGQQEPLGSDFPSILFEQEAEHLNNCGGGEAGPPGTTGLSEGAPDSAQLTPAEKRIVQSNERLVQEMRAFRREYAESCRETTSVLRGIAQALGGLSRSLAEIRDLYLREQAVPKP
ncbi:LOW QUALITY PROTEIN: uncharacterized protein J5M81_013729 [Pluvialis apricaria]